MLGSLKGLAKGIQILNEIIQECNTEMLGGVQEGMACFWRHFIFLRNGRKFYCVEVVLPWRG